MSPRESLETLENCRATLHDQLFLQTAAMFKYCLNNGISIAEEHIREFDRIFELWIGARQERGVRNSTAESGEGKAGAGQPPVTATMSAGIDLAKVNDIHRQLAEKVAPARPAAILLIESEMQRKSTLRYFLGLHFLGPVKIVRAMMGASILMLVIFLALSCSEAINQENLNKTLYDQHGRTLFYNMLFLLSSAGLGASFSALFEIRPYIAMRTYDTVYSTDYWIRFILGVMSGLILAELVPVEQITSQNETMTDLTRPLLAMLGGFSVQVVYRILQRIVQTLETLVQGESTVKEEVVKAKAQDETSRQVMKIRTEVLQEVAEVQKLISKGENMEEIQQAVDKLFDKTGSLGTI